MLVVAQCFCITHLDIIASIGHQASTLDLHWIVVTLEWQHIIGNRSAFYTPQESISLHSFSHRHFLFYFCAWSSCCWLLLFGFVLFSSPPLVPCHIHAQLPFCFLSCAQSIALYPLRISNVDLSFLLLL